MMTPFFQLTLFLVLLAFLFFISRLTTNNLFRFLQRFFRSDKIVFTLISLVFFPGTVVHELAHYLAATVLFLRVREISIFPQRKGNYIKLGHVLYEKKDFVRGVIVGIAPIIIGILFLFGLSLWNIFPSPNIAYNLLLIYLIFTISSTMFSSKQDLVDLIYLLPFLYVAIIVLYVFRTDASFMFQNYGEKAFNNIFTKINPYLLLCIGIHIIIIILLKLFTKLSSSFDI